MTRLSAAVLLALVLSGSAAHAQVVTPKHNALGIAFGVGDLASHDALGSPLIYSGFTLPVGGLYLYKDSSTQHRLSADLTVSGVNAPGLESSIREWHRHAYYAHGALTYEYMRSAGAAFNGRADLWLGGALDIRGFLRFYKYTGSDLYTAEGALSGEASISLAPSIELQRTFNEGSTLAATLQVPLVAAIARPPWGYYSDQVVEGRVEVIGQFAAWNARIEATRLLSDYFWLRLSIQNVYYHYSLQEWTTAAINTTASVGVEWRFRW